MILESDTSIGRDAKELRTSLTPLTTIKEMV